MHLLSSSARLRSYLLFVASICSKNSEDENNGKFENASLEYWRPNAASKRMLVSRKTFFIYSKYIVRGHHSYLPLLT